MRLWHSLATLTTFAAAGAGAPHILPTPHYFEAQDRRIEGPFRVVAEQAHPKLAIAAQMLGKALPAGARATVHLWDYSANSQPPVKLNLLDREVLNNPSHWGQSYVVIAPDKDSVWVIGASAQGAIWGTA